MCYGESFASLVCLEQHSENGVCWGKHISNEVNVVNVFSIEIMKKTLAK